MERLWSRADATGGKGDRPREPPKQATSHVERPRWSSIRNVARERRRRAHAKRLRGQAQRVNAKRELWDRTRSGSHAGRGFHYQDRIATEIALEHLQAGTLVQVVPEGLEDISLETMSRTVHVQAKSRREGRGEFRASELRGVFTNLAERLVADVGSSVVLVLERPVADWPRLGEEVRDGRASVPGADPALAAQMRVDIARDLAGHELRVDDFLPRLTVEVRDGLPETSLRLLSELLSIPVASCHAHFFALQDALGALADKNGERDLSEAATLAVGDLLQLFERVSERVDPSGLVEPVRDGICELIDFRTTIIDERFYAGVDALPGHVSAGLTVGRPELTSSLLGAARDHGRALVVGPSGAGKSALLWLAAWESHQEIIWYRVQKLRAEDVIKLVRFARGALPTARAPLGFLVDDLGQPQSEGWDDLARELSSFEHVYLVGACREENLLDVVTAASTTQVRPQLDEPLAMRLYEELRARNATTWGGWREPFEASRGLLLEYVHLLTAGERLQETIRAQVDERRRAGAARESELEVLRLVATADTFGAEVDATQLQTHLGLSSPALQRALARLIDEHLIAERREGRLGGMHALRSRAIQEELHRLPPLRLETTAADVVQLLDPLALQTFLSQLLATEIAAEPVLASLAARVASNPDAAVLGAALQALRISGFVTTAWAWARIMQEENVAPMHADLLSSLALLPNSEVDILSEEIQRAVRRMRAEPVRDLRQDLLARLDEAALVSAFQSASPGEASALLAVLARTDATPPASVIAGLVPDDDLDSARLVLQAANDVSLDLAQRIAVELGGSEALLERLENHLPWIRNARLEHGEEDEVVAAADYALVAESSQTDAHKEVVELCRYLLALAPEAGGARARAIDATGEVAGLGVPIADKAIPRANLPSNAAIAWNRSTGRALARAIAARSSTERLIQERELLAQAADAVAKASRAYLTGVRVPEAIAAAVVLALSAQTLLPPPEAVEVAGPLEFGPGDMKDPAGFLATMIPNNLVDRLLDDDSSVALLIPKLLAQLDELGDPERWLLLDDKPTEAISRLRRDLRDLHTVVSEVRATGGAQLHVLRRIASQGRTSPLRRAADRVRKSVEQRLAQQSRQIEQQLAALGFPTTVLWRPSDLDSPYWPQSEALVISETPSIHEWYTDLEQIVQSVRHHLDGQPPFFAAPAREGVVCKAFAVHVIGDKVFPALDNLGDWPNIALPTLEENASLVYRRCVSAITEASAIVGAFRSPPTTETSGVLMHDVERRALESAVTRAQGALNDFTELCERHAHDELLREALELLTDLGAVAEQEAQARNEGGPPWQGFAAEVTSGMRGDPTDRYILHFNATIALTEWDIEPTGALDRFHEGIARIERRGQTPPADGDDGQRSG